MILGHRAMMLALVFGAFLLIPMTVRGDEVADLKVTFEQKTAALNKHDLEAYMVFWHDEVVVFGPVAPFPAEGKAALRQLMQAVFTNSESATWTVINPQYRVIGSTGVVYFYDAAAIKPKDGPLQNHVRRVTATWTKLDGKWVGVAVHVSPIKVGD
jgi:ketosteroid isomerase-like protein